MQGGSRRPPPLLSYKIRQPCRPTVRPTTSRPTTSRPQASPESRPKLKPKPSSRVGKKNGPNRRPFTNARSLGHLDFQFRQKKTEEPNPTKLFLKSKSFSSSYPSITLTRPQTNSRIPILTAPIHPPLQSECRSPPSSPLAKGANIISLSTPDPATARDPTVSQHRPGNLGPARRARKPSNSDQNTTETTARIQIPSLFRRQDRRVQEDVSSAEEEDIIAGDVPIPNSPALVIPPATVLPPVTALSPVTVLPPVLTAPRSLILGPDVPPVATLVMTPAPAPAPAPVFTDCLFPPPFESNATPPYNRLSVKTPGRPSNRRTSHREGRPSRKGLARVVSMNDEGVSPATVRILEAVSMKCGIASSVAEEDEFAFNVNTLGSPGVAEMLLMKERGVMDNPFL
ncbi:hypothetical protein BC936DRAFT_145836 [Jimgerdemannia flammicorona]|uniref:Uncharacterized protein n=1 Tax=Jimgerdemannia flammicorona TaxID=994334 RepID=A0A433D943_9FUNG|nr:hypothetical protein BC936DRAFT_145836 [Jimgerdemannia flammicorona]